MSLGTDYDRLRLVKRERTSIAPAQVAPTAKSRLVVEPPSGTCWHFLVLCLPLPSLHPPPLLFPRSAIPNTGITRDRAPITSNRLTVFFIITSLHRLTE